MRCLKFFIVLATLCAGHVAASAATYTVTNTTQFNSLPTTLHAGDVVIIRNGTYGALNRTFTSSITDDATAQSNPVRIYAETPGGVIVNSASRIALRGSGIVLAGIDFVSGSGGATSWIINLDANSRYMRLNNLRFLDCSAPSVDDNWIFLQGFNHTIEYCAFLGKRSVNAVIAAKRNTAEAGATVPRNHLIRYCYFGPREGSPTANGYETIRVGDSSSQIFDMRVTIEHCVFYRAIWGSDGQKPNDMEIISNKSKGNVYRHNTFLESTGQLTLRHGDACLVEGNFIFGGGHYSADGSRILLRAANPYQTGIRVIGTDHIVRNNYLINLRSVNLRAALCLMAGATTWNDGNGTSGDNGYESADRAEIYHNTFIDCGEINLGYVDTGSRQPVGVKIFNNVWQSTAPGLGVVRNAAFTPASSGGNFIYSSGTLGWNGLGGTYSTSNSPRVDEVAGDLRIPVANSALLDAADATLTAESDLRGLPRPAQNRDIGAYEREVAGTGARPLLRAEVGPEFAGGPIGRYPIEGGVTVATAPAITQAPEALVATSGGSAVFTAVASGSPRPTFQWFKDGAEITNNPSAFTATLTLPQVKFSDVGHYSVRVANAAGHDTSAQVPLSVAAPAQLGAVVDEKFADGNRNDQSQPASLAWYCSGASSKLTVANGAMTLNSDGTAGRHAVGYFTLPAPTLSVGDRFVLRFDFSVAGTLRDQTSGLRLGLFNSAGSTLLTSDSNTTPVTYAGYALTANLNPTGAPNAELRRRNAVSNTLITSLSSYTLLTSGGIGQPFAADTVYSGTLELEVLAGGQIAISAAITGGDFGEAFQLATTDTATITQLDTIAFAIGSSGGTAAAGTLTLDNIRLEYHPSTTGGAPTITEQPLDRTTAPGGSAAFSVSASSSGTMTYQWRKDGVAIAGATQPTLTLSNVQATDVGNYSVQISSSGGITLSGTATLSLSAADGYTAYVAARGLTGEAADPSADPDGDGFANLLEYLLDGNPLVNDTALAPQLSLDAIDGVWRLTFRVRADASPAQWQIESSAGMQTWHTVAHGAENVTIVSTPDGAGFMNVTATLPATAAPLFIRLRAEMP